MAVVFESGERNEMEEQSRGRKEIKAEALTVIMRKKISSKTPFLFVLPAHLMVLRSSVCTRAGNGLSFQQMSSRNFQ